MWKLLNKENPTSLQNKFTFVYVMKKIGMIPKYCLPYFAEELWSFRLVLEGITGKETPESSRLEFLEKF